MFVNQVSRETLVRSHGMLRLVNIVINVINRLGVADPGFKMRAGSAAICLKFPATSGEERGVSVDPSSSSQ
jgi:hypothetical protein